MFQATIATNKIREAYRAKQKIKIIQGGTSASKTYSIIALLISYAASIPNKEVSVVAESIPHLRRGALKDFIKIMTSTGRFRTSGFNKSLLRYEFKNGSYIEFFSADQPDKLRGARRDVLFINEANNVPFEAYNQLAIRTKEQIWLDFNPTMRFWAHNELMDEAFFLKLTYKDNGALDDSIIQDLEARRKKAKTSTYWQNWCRVYLDGEIGTLEGVCIPEWKEITVLPTEARLVCYGLDFGYSIDPTCLVGIYKYNDSYIFDEIIYRKGLLNSDISNLLKSNNTHGVIYADSAEPKSIEELRQRGHSITGAQKGRDSIVYGIELINQQNILITSRSKNIINELQNYSWQSDREGGYIKKPIDAFNHAVDAMRYGLGGQLKTPNAGKYFIY